MKIEIDVSDSTINEIIINQVKDTVRKRVDLFMSSNEITQSIQAMCRTELGKIAAGVINQEKIKEMMDTKATQLLPEILNDKFAGAYIAVMVAEARKAAELSVKSLQQNLEIKS